MKAEAQRRREQVVSPTGRAEIEWRRKADLSRRNQMKADAKADNLGLKDGRLLGFRASYLLLFNTVSFLVNVRPEKKQKLAKTMSSSS